MLNKQHGKTNFIGSVLGKLAWKFKQNLAVGEGMSHTQARVPSITSHGSYSW